MADIDWSKGEITPPAAASDDSIDWSKGAITPPAKPRGFLPYIGQQAKAGLTSDLPTIAGKALQYAGATDLGGRMRAYGEANAAENAPDPSQGPITQAVAGALRGAAPIAPLAVGGLLAQGTPVGPALDIAGAAALAGGFGGSQAQDTLEKAKAAGKSDEEARSIANKTGLITGVGMGLVGAATSGVAAPALRALAGTGAKTAGDVIASEAAPGFVRPFVADTAGHLAGNVASMAAANAATAGVEQNAGLSGPTPGAAALEGVESGAGLTAALLPFGLARGALANRANAAAVARLQNPQADPAQRAQVADRIHTNLQAVDPGAAENFAQHATQAISNSQPLELGAHLLEPPAEGQYQPKAEAPTTAAPLALPAPGTVAPGQTLVVNQDGTVATPPQMDLLRRPSDISETGAMGLGRNSDVTDVTPREPTPAQKMGIDANAGPISNAAAIAVDSGAHQANSEGAAATGNYSSGIEANRALKAIGEPGKVVRADGGWRIQLDNPEQGNAQTGTDKAGSQAAAAVGSAKPAETVPKTGAAAENAQAAGLRPFPPAVGSLGVPRADMPQITPTTHGPLTQFLAARGITHEVADADPRSLKPAQGEYDPAKVREQQANDASRTVLTSSDGYILDGTHQWLSRFAAGEPIKTIRFDAPIKDLLPLAKEFPSAQTAEEQTQAAPADAAGKAGPKSAAAEPAGNRAAAPAAKKPAPALTPRTGEGSKSAMEAMQRQQQGKPSVQPTDILNDQGAPFRNRMAAGVALKKAGAGHEVAPLAEGGFVVRPLPKEEAAPAEPKALHVGITPGNAEPVTIKDGIVHIGKEPALDFNSGDPVKVKAGATDADLKQALKDAGALSRRQKFFGGEAEAPDNKLRIVNPKGPAGGRNARSAAYEANPLKAFIAEHGLAPELAQEFAPGIRERRAAMVPGYGPIFRKGGLKMDALAERAEQDGFIPKGDHDANRLYDLVARAMRGERIIPQYAEGAVEKEAQKHIDAHRELADLMPHDLDAEGYERVDPELQAEVRSLIDKAERSGIDYEAILDDVVKRSKNGTQDEYHAAASKALREALDAHAREASARAQDRGGPAGAQGDEPQGTAEGLTAPTKAEVLAAAARKESAPALDAKAQIDREAKDQTLTQPVAPEQRKDTSGDMFAREKAQVEVDKKNTGKPKDDGGTVPMFSQDTTEGTPLRVSEIRKAIAPALDSLKVPYELHSSIGEARDSSGLSDIPGGVKGMYYGGKLHLVAEGIKSALEAEETLWHEVNHAGIDRIYGSSKNAEGYYNAMRGLAMQNANIREAAKEWLKEFGADDTKARIAAGMTKDAAELRTKLQAVEEALSNLAGKNAKINGAVRFIAKVQEFMRAVGLNRLADALEGKTDAQALAMIFKAREAVTKEPRTERAPQLAPSFSEDHASFSRTLDKISDRIDAIKGAAVAKDVGTAYDGLLMATNPAARSDAAKEMARTLIAGMGEKEMRSIQFRTKLNAAIQETAKATTLSGKARDLMEKGLTVQADKVFLRNTPEDNHAFMQAMDTGDEKYFAAHPELKPMADVISRMFDEKAKEIQGLGTGALQAIRENYFPHIWNREPSGDAQREIFTTLAKRPLEGRKGFTKERVFDDVRAGLDAGFEPVSNNPLDLVALKMEEMDKYILAHKTLNAMEGSNGVHLIAAGEKTPQGFTDVNGRFGSIERNGEKLRYVARDDVAQVINNYLSPSLYHNKYVGKPFTAYMGAANTLNQFQLGVFSAFHAGFTSMEAVISHAAIGVKSLTAGDFKGAAHYLGSAPAAWINNPKMGSKIIAHMMDSAAHPEMAPILEGLQLAGFKWQMDNRFRTDATKNMLQAWQDGKKFKAGLNSIGAVAEQTARPILEWLVPRQKFGVFGEMYSKWMQDNPQATHEELRNSAQQIWNRVDSRLGQVVYDRLFVHNVAKNFAQMLIRAPGWTGGTILEVGGGIKDLAGYMKALASGKKPESISDRAAYTLSMLMVTALANATMTALFTGESPQDWRDLVAFRTGNIDENGRPERFMLPTYMKDVYAYAKAPGTTLLNKSHPLLSLIGDIGKNRDFYGTEIRSEDANILTQLAQTAGFAAKAFLPFWVKGVQKEQQREGSALATAAPLVGVMPAPSDLNKTAAEKLMTQYGADRMPQGSRTQEETDKADLRRQMFLALRKGEVDKAKELFAQGRDAGLFAPRDFLKVMHQAHTDPLVASFQHLTFEQAQRVMKAATETEKTQLQPAFARKTLEYRRQHAGAAPPE